MLQVHLEVMNSLGLLSRETLVEQEAAVVATVLHAVPIAPLRVRPLPVVAVTSKNVAQARQAHCGVLVACRVVVVSESAPVWVSHGEVESNLVGMGLDMAVQHVLVQKLFTLQSEQREFKRAQRK